MTTRSRTRKKIHHPRKTTARMFIDANQYLYLYTITQGKRLLEALNEQQSYIFVTKQICDEVERNKLQVAAKFLTEHFEQLKVRTFEVPDHLLDVSSEAATDLRNQLKQINGSVKKVNKDLRTAANEALQRISRSEDQVSLGLSEIFSKAIVHKPEDLDRARQRKELGNPPGKKTGPVGDQLNWEQLLSHWKNATDLWIVTKDSDYCTSHYGEMFLNPLLYQDIVRASRKAPTVFCFDSLPDALRHFVDKTRVKAERLPTAEESKQIKEEIDSLPPIGFLSATMNDVANAAVQAAYEQRRQASARIAAISTEDTLNQWRDDFQFELK